MILPIGVTLVVTLRLDLSSFPSAPLLPASPAAFNSANKATAKQFLQRPNTVMDHRLLDHINVLVRELGLHVAKSKAMQLLMNIYGGGTAIWGLMGLWLAELKATSDAGGSGLAGKEVGTNGKMTTRVARNAGLVGVFEYESCRG